MIRTVRLRSENSQTVHPVVPLTSTAFAQYFAPQVDFLWIQTLYFETCRAALLDVNHCTSRSNLFSVLIHSKSAWQAKVWWFHRCMFPVVQYYNVPRHTLADRNYLRILTKCLQERRAFNDSHAVCLQPN